MVPFFCFSFSVVLNFNALATLRQRFQKDHVNLNFEKINDRQIYFLFWNPSFLFVICFPLQKCTKMDWTNQLTLADLNFALHSESFQDYRS